MKVCAGWCDITLLEEEFNIGPYYAGSPGGVTEICSCIFVVEGFDKILLTVKSNVPIIDNICIQQGHDCITFPDCQECTSIVDAAGGCTTLIDDVKCKYARVCVTVSVVPATIVICAHAKACCGG